MEAEPIQITADGEILSYAGANANGDLGADLSPSMPVGTSVSLTLVYDQATPPPFTAAPILGFSLTFGAGPGPITFNPAIAASTNRVSVGATQWEFDLYDLDRDGTSGALTGPEFTPTSAPMPTTNWIPSLIRLFLPAPADSSQLPSSFDPTFLDVHYILGFINSSGGEGTDDRAMRIGSFTNVVATGGDASSVPEPASGLLVGIAAAALAAARASRKRRLARSN